MIDIKEPEKTDIEKVISFKRELWPIEPDTCFREPDAVYEDQLGKSSDDQRFNTAEFFITLQNERVIGWIDASLITGRSDASCSSAYQDLICVLKNERHHKAARMLLKKLRNECRAPGAGMLTAHC